MRVNFEANTHLISEICQDNKKRVNIFYSVHMHAVVRMYIVRASKNEDPGIISPFHLGHWHLFKRIISVTLTSLGVMHSENARMVLET